MLILAIDTALAACAAAVFDTDGGKVLASETLGMARGHAEALMPLVARVMGRAGLAFHQLDRIAVTAGPGSFTGLRVGISAARGIALVSGKPAVGVSTLAAYAAPHIANEAGDAVVASIDARHGHVYLQALAGAGRTLVGPHLASLEDAVRVATAAPARLVGSAAGLLAAAWPTGAASPVLVEAEEAPAIAWVARLGAAASHTDVAPTPLYLRPPDARPQDTARLPRR